MPGLSGNMSCFWTILLPYGGFGGFPLLRGDRWNTHQTVGAEEHPESWFCLSVCFILKKIQRLSLPSALRRVHLTV